MEHYSVYTQNAPSVPFGALIAHVHLAVSSITRIRVVSVGAKYGVVAYTRQWMEYLTSINVDSSLRLSSS